MRSSTPTFVRMAIALSIGASLLSGCSGSDSDAGDPRAPADTGEVGTDEVNAIANDPVTDSTSGIDDDPAGGTMDEAAGETTGGAAGETATGGEADSTTAVPDSLVQNSTRVDFDITVPAFVSDALQVRLTWDDKDIAASWVGDEFWMASDDFPTDTAHRLVVTCRC